MGKIRKTVRKGASWAVRKHPVGNKAYDMYSDRKGKINRVRGKVKKVRGRRRPRRRERSR